MNDTKKGMLFIIMAAFFFASMNVFVKLSGDLSSIQKSFFRNLIAALFAFIILIKSKEGFTYQKKVQKRTKPVMIPPETRTDCPMRVRR